MQRVPQGTLLLVSMKRNSEFVSPFNRSHPLYPFRDIGKSYKFINLIVIANPGEVHADYCKLFHNSKPLCNGRRKEIDLKHRCDFRNFITFVDGALTKISR